MKIKPSVKRNVDAAVADFRKVIVGETIGLLKQIGAEYGQDVFFGRTLFLHQSKGNVTETIPVDNISYADGRSGTPYYMVAYGCGKDFCRSDIMLSLSDLQVVYEEVRNIVRKH